MQDKKLQNSIEEDLGLGDKVIQQNRSRYVNKDGSFNVHRKGVFEHGSFSPYHAVLNASWKKFLFGVLIYYIAANILFSFLYLLCGKAAFPDINSLGVGQRLGQLLFYSIQIISTLGSSPLHPATVPAQIILALEAMVGLFGFAIGASLMFARLSNPSVRIIFSNKALIAPYQDGTGFMLRIINGRDNELIDVSASLTLAMVEKDGKRSFHRLNLERDSVLTFPVNWTIVHPITPNSPIYGMNLKDLAAVQAEFIISITATDQELSRKVFTRTSYFYDEVLAGAKFSYIIELDKNGRVTVDPKRISELEEI
jgi:inward rectifier potassium channel